MSDHQSISRTDYDERKKAFTEALTNHFSAFFHRTFCEVSPADQLQMSWYIQAICYHLQLCAERKIRRLIINIPPRHAKSISASVAFPAWLLARDPSERICGISYSAELAMRFSRDTRTVMNAAWYSTAFPKTRLLRAAAHDLQTTAHGARFATSIDGTLTGLGGNIFLIDDPNPASDEFSATGRDHVLEWFGTTLSSRFNNISDGVVVVIQQRLHADDLSGFLLASQGEHWVHLNLPLIATQDERIAIGPDQWHDRRVGDILDPSRETLETVEERRRNMTAKTFAAQMQQDPVPEDGEVIKWGWLRQYQNTPPFGEGDRRVQSWDTASKAGELNDYSVCSTWLIKGRDYYLLDVWRGRVTFPDLKRQVYEQGVRWSIDDLLIEDKGSGTQLIDQLLEEDDERLPRPIRRTPKEDKIIRMAAQCSVMEQGRVHVPQDANFMPVFRSELLQFPNAKFDDQVDSVSQFLEWATETPQSKLLVGTFGRGGIVWHN
jgi:predicted phage terminase large subunit-like protein